MKQLLLFLAFAAFLTFPAFAVKPVTKAGVPKSNLYKVQAESSFDSTATFKAKIAVGNSATPPTISAGSGTPEGAVTAPIGSLFLRTEGSTSTTLYVKTSGTGNTGWTAK